MRGFLAFVAAVVIPACYAMAVEVSIAPDRMLVVDGQRTFIIGMYENPKEDSVLDEVAQAGFNLIHASGDAASLDRLQSRGIYAWVNIGGQTEIGENRAEGEKVLKETVEKCGSHPNLLVWELADESLWSCYLNAYHSQSTLVDMANVYHKSASEQAARMATGYKVMKELDPHHPIWENYAAGNSHEQVVAHAQGADIIGADIYPVMPYPTHPFDVSRLGLAYVGMTTMKMQNAAPEKPIWMVLQGMSWADTGDLFGRRPEPGQYPVFDETRFMAMTPLCAAPAACCTGAPIWSPRMPLSGRTS